MGRQWLGKYDIEELGQSNRKWFKFDDNNDINNCLKNIIDRGVYNLTLDDHNYIFTFTWLNNKIEYKIIK